MFGIAGVKELSLMMRVKDNEIQEARWVIPVPGNNDMGYGSTISGWLLISAIDASSTFVHVNQIYSPLDGKPFKQKI